MSVLNAAGATRRTSWCLRSAMNLLQLTLMPWPRLLFLKAVLGPFSSMFDHFAGAGSVKSQMAPVYLEDFMVCRPPDEWLVDADKLREGQANWKVRHHNAILNGSSMYSVQACSHHPLFFGYITHFRYILVLSPSALHACA